MSNVEKSKELVEFEKVLFKLEQKIYKALTFAENDLMVDNYSELSDDFMNLINEYNKNDFQDMSIANRIENINLKLEDIRYAVVKKYVDMMHEQYGKPVKRKVEDNINKNIKFEEIKDMLEELSALVHLENVLIFNPEEKEDEDIKVDMAYFSEYLKKNGYNNESYMEEISRRYDEEVPSIRYYNDNIVTSQPESEHITYTLRDIHNFLNDIRIELMSRAVLNEDVDKYTR